MRDIWSASEKGVTLQWVVRESFSLGLLFENKIDGCEEVCGYMRKLHWEKLVQSLQEK